MDQHPFHTQALLASEISMFRPNGKRPPKSVELVIDLTWVDSCRWRTYFIAADRKQFGWHLWEKGSCETGEHAFVIVARGYPYSGYSARDAAERLLTEAWRREYNAWLKELSGSVVTQSGLLKESDVRRIEDELFPEEKEEATVPTQVIERPASNILNFAILFCGGRGPRDGCTAHH